MSVTRTMYTGTIEYLTVTVVADVSLDNSDAVAISFDRVTWLTATWLGSAGMTRQCQVLLGAGNALPTKPSQTVYVRVTDNPEAPVLNAGTLIIK